MSSLLLRNNVYLNDYVINTTFLIRSTIDKLSTASTRKALSPPPPPPRTDGSRCIAASFVIIVDNSTGFVVVVVVVVVVVSCCANYKRVSSAECI